MNSLLCTPGGARGRITRSHTPAAEATKTPATGHPPVFGRMSPAHGPAAEATKTPATGHPPVFGRMSPAHGPAAEATTEGGAS